MKKIIAMLLAVMMLFALAACGQSAAPAEQPAQHGRSQHFFQPEAQRHRDEPDGVGGRGYRVNRYLHHRKIRLYGFVAAGRALFGRGHQHARFGRGAADFG